MGKHATMHHTKLEWIFALNQEHFDLGDDKSGTSLIYLEKIRLELFNQG